MHKKIWDLAESQFSHTDFIRVLAYFVESNRLEQLNTFLNTYSAVKAYEGMDEI